MVTTGEGPCMHSQSTGSSASSLTPESREGSRGCSQSCRAQRVLPESRGLLSASEEHAETSMLC